MPDEKTIADGRRRVLFLCTHNSARTQMGARQRWHWSLPDPSLARGSQDEQLAVYRRVRDTLRERIQLELLSQSG
jgi:protein-tyrosine-phosphatase